MELIGLGADVAFVIQEFRVSEHRACELLDLAASRLFPAVKRRMVGKGLRLFGRTARGCAAGGSVLPEAHERGRSEDLRAESACASPGLPPVDLSTRPDRELLSLLGGGPLEQLSEALKMRSKSCCH